MPRYRKGDRAAFVFTNQDAVLYHEDDKQQDFAILKIPGVPKSKKLTLFGIPTVGILKQISVTPMYGRFMMSFIMEDCAPPFYPDLPNMAGLDFGTDNIAALACTDGSSVVCKGGAVLSENRLFAKNKADSVSLLTQGKVHAHAESKHLTRLSLQHYCRQHDMMHKISCRVIEWCIEHRVGVLVIGTNKFWKQNADMGKRNNQNFVSIPHAELRQMIAYKAMIAGITVIEQEESYTSKSDVTANDPIPVYGHVEGKPSFSGRRISRGRYQTHSGLIINADCNGAANILALSLFLWDEPFLTVSEVLCPRSSTGALCSPCICTPGRTVGASPRGPRSRNSFIHQILLYGFLDASMIFRKKYSSSGRP